MGFICIIQKDIFINANIIDYVKQLNDVEI